MLAREELGDELRAGWQGGDYDAAPIAREDAEAVLAGARGLVAAVEAKLA